MNTRALAPRVLMLGPLPPPVGGMATVVANLLAALAADCDVALLNTVKTTAPNRRLPQALLAHGRLLLRLGAHCLAGRRVVHIHTCSWFSFWRNAVDVVVAKALGRRVVLHVHGAEFHRFLNALSPLQARVMRLVLARCDRVVTLGPHWQRLLGQWCDESRVVVIANGVPVPTLAERPRGAVFTIVCLANYERRKAQEDLLHAVARLRASGPVHLALLGMEAEPGRAASLSALAVELGIADAVSIPGPVSGEAKARWWARADAFCLPSHDEGLPMSMLEAMAHGIPVVVTRVGSIPEAIENHRHGLLFTPGDVDQLHDHLQALLTQPARARQLGLAGRARVTEAFSLETSCAALLALYRGLA